MLIFSLMIARLPDKIIEYNFYILFFLVPLIWLPVNSELFEFNKIVLVYLGTSIIIGAWGWKTVNEKSFTIKRTPIDIPLLLFLFANILSTIFSIDPQTSVFGYYSRFNGGLLSTFAYIILFYTLVTFFDREKLFQLLKILLLSTALVAIYGILQHPNPLFRNPDGTFRGIDAGYWAVDSQSRVFSTLGHANWLAAFLAMVIPIALYFTVSAKYMFERILYSLLIVISFLAFTFTYSRAGTLGLAAGSLIIILTGIYGLMRRKPQVSTLAKSIFPFKSGFFLILVFVSAAMIIQFFGNAFIERGVDIKQITAKVEEEASGPTLTSNIGAETGKLRLIVWTGTVEVFKNYPLFGSGVETFGFSYLRFKPIEQNLSRDWDTLYNKAHNEFLNYLATTGLFGFGTYIFLISSFVVWVLIKVYKNLLGRQEFFLLLLLAGYMSYHVQNFFGFSVVAIAFLFFSIPGFAFITSDSLSQIKIPIPRLEKSIYKRSAKAFGSLLFIVLVYFSLATWLADFYYNKAVSTTDDHQSYQSLKLAIFLRPDEPLYKANLGRTILYDALSFKGDERRSKIQEGFVYLNQAIASSPSNFEVWRIRMEPIFDLALDDKNYLPQAISTAEKLSSLAPTDPLTQYNLAAVYRYSQDFKKTQLQLEKLIELKFDYKDAWDMLLETDADLKDKESLKKHYQEYKTYFPEAAKEKEQMLDI